MGRERVRDKERRMLRERERVTKRKKLDHRGLGAGVVEVEPPVANEVLLDV